MNTKKYYKVKKKKISMQIFHRKYTRKKVM